MAQASEIMTALKRLLRQHGVTYAQVARALSLSESSVKRLFSSGDLSLKRLQEVCSLIDIEFIDLVQAAEDQRRNVDQLSEEQEQALVDDTKLFLCAFLLLNLWSVEEIVAEYDINELEAVRLLAKLDRLKIIDALPGNQARLRLSRNFNWRRNGPIQRFFEDQVQAEFFASRFDGPLDLRLVLNGSVSEQSIKIIQQRFGRIAVEFESLVKEDRRRELAERHGTTAIMAIRPWGLTAFERFRRDPSRRTDRSPRRYPCA